MTQYHPRKNDKGQLVRLLHPSQPTDQSTWHHADQLATVTPDGPMPEQVNHLAISSWRDAPTDSAGWERLAGVIRFDEPPMKTTTGLPPASGAVVIEPDGRVWVVSPSNGFGDYVHTFPKGKLDPKKGLSLRANALKEVFEESGLRVDPDHQRDPVLPGHAGRREPGSHGMGKPGSPLGADTRTGTICLTP